MQEPGRGPLRRLLGRLSAGVDGADPPLTLPSATAYAYWDFREPASVLEWDLSIEVDPGTDVGHYLALFNGSIDGSACYLGLQSDVFSPEAGTGIGKGLIFSTWWSFDAADTRVAEDGFRELGTHEGRFVGVRRPYPWTAGDYRVTLSRAEAETVGGRELDWFDLFIEPLAPSRPGGRAATTGSRQWIGALRFPRLEPGRPARIEPGGVLFLEVYSGAEHWSDVTAFRASLMAFGDSLRCPRGRTEYPRPYGRSVPRTSIGYDPATERIVVARGPGVTGKVPAGSWP